MGWFLSQRIHSSGLTYSADVLLKNGVGVQVKVPKEICDTCYTQVLADVSKEAQYVSVITLRDLNCI